MSAPLVDLHIDTLDRILHEGVDAMMRGGGAHVDLLGLQEAGVRAAIWAVCTAHRHQALSGTAAAIRMLALAEDLLRRAEGRLVPVRTAADLETCGSGEASGMVLGLEGAEALQGSIELLPAFHALGVRVLTLTWNGRTPFACGCGVEPDADSGLSDAGRELLQLADELSLLIDLSHASPRTLDDSLAQLSGPVTVTHTACAALCPHRRNLTDEQMRAVAATGGVIGITLCPAFLAPGGEGVTVSTVVDHLLHALSVVGEEHVAIGTDLDGITALPEGIQGVRDLPAILAALAARGGSEEAVAAVAGGNGWRLLHEALPGGTSG